jgi:hypothetical protein
MPEKQQRTYLKDSARPAVSYRGALSSLFLLLAMTVALATPSFGQQSYLIQTGLPVYLSTLTLHVQGQPVTVEYLVVSLYPMNTPPPWPVGLWLDLYLQADTSGDGPNKSTWGQGQWCRWWFNQVAQLETQNVQQVPFAYLEVNLPAGIALVQTDEGIPIYPAGSVTCWQANNDFTAP